MYKPNEIFNQRGYYWVKICPNDIVKEQYKQVFKKELSLKTMTAIVDYDGGFATEIVHGTRRVTFSDFNSAFNIIEYKYLEDLEFLVLEEEI